MTQLPAHLRAQLDRLPPRVLVEYLGQRLEVNDQELWAQALKQGKPAIDLRSLFELGLRRMNPFLTTIPVTLELRFVDGVLRWLRPTMTLKVSKLDELERERPRWRQHELSP